MIGWWDLLSEQYKLFFAFVFNILLIPVRCLHLTPLRITDPFTYLEKSSAFLNNLQDCTRHADNVSNRITS
jgi:hypothetical protein